ncbi:unnamed protein product [Diamesa serratosioi]
MPQGKRKLPFSGKKKKQQLILKKQDKPLQLNLIRNIKGEESDVSEPSECAAPPFAENINKINMQPLKDPRSKSNKYVLQFHTESPKELKEMRERARHVLEYATEQQMEIDNNYFIGYGFPHRPDWNFKMSKDVLLANEERYFFKYITHMEKTHYDDMKNLSFCELNLETWRQLWRVLELSDIVLVVADARFPALMFPPSLYDFVNRELNKSMVIVLNKIDLVDASAVLAWKKYFEAEYPTISVVLFTSCPAYNLRGNQVNKTGMKIRRRRGKQRMASEGALGVFKACSAIVGGAVDLSNWEQKILDEIQSLNHTDDNDDDDESGVEAEKTHDEEKDFDFEQHVLYKNGVLTIGCIGFPNVGKSSLLNALMGKKVVSVSRTPGHTKHFQTIFLTNTVRLCDCPGLVFPSSTPRSLQVLMGSFPIAQLREPYNTIRFIAERIDIPTLLSVTHPEGKGEEWSAMDVCDAYALKRGFLTAKAARPDTYRAANSILRMALDGKITLSLKPVGFSFKKKFWENHTELDSVKAIQALGKPEINADDYEYSDSDNEGGAVSSDYKMKEKLRTKNAIENGEDAEDEDDDDDEDEDVVASVSNAFSMLLDTSDM